MAAVLSFPFRLAPLGSVVKVDEGSQDYDIEMVAAHLLTRRGERPMVPNFGIDDPTFRTPDAADLSASLNLYGPDVDVQGYEVTFPTDRSAAVVVTID